MDGPWLRLICRSDSVSRGRPKSKRKLRLLKRNLSPLRPNGLPCLHPASKVKKLDELNPVRAVSPDAGVDCRRNGHRSTKDILFLKYQRAARLFVRDLRRGGWNRSYGRAYARASRRDAALCRACPARLPF